jgi:hypothetical protein
MRLDHSAAFIHRAPHSTRREFHAATFGLRPVYARFVIEDVDLGRLGHLARGLEGSVRASEERHVRCDSGRVRAGWRGDIGPASPGLARRLSGGVHAQALFFRQACGRDVRLVRGGTGHLHRLTLGQGQDSFGTSSEISGGRKGKADGAIMEKGTLPQLGWSAFALSSPSSLFIQQGLI